VEGPRSREPRQQVGVAIRSREFLRRLDKLGLPGEDEPELVHDFGVLSRVENARFWELYDAFRQDEDLAKDELTEMQVLLDRCPLVDPREAGNPYTETHEERRERQLLERAFAGAFHDYAKQYPYIAVPNYANRLNEYRLEIGYQLFEKYGWVPDKRDCSGVLPLDQWVPEDREALIDLYRRANPECSGNALPGWKSKYRRWHRF
jgi:hypothetical protein